MPEDSYLFFFSVLAVIIPYADDVALQVGVTIYTITLTTMVCTYSCEQGILAEISLDRDVVIHHIL